MNDDITKSFLDSINSLPPLIRYPALLALCKSITEVLPQAEKEYHDEARGIIERFLEIAREVNRND